MLEIWLARSLTVMVSSAMSKTQTSLGDKLRKWRKEHGKSTKDAGAIIGVSGVQWHRYETGDRSVPLERLLQISSKTGLNLIQLRPDLAIQIRASEAAQ